MDLVNSNNLMLVFITETKLPKDRVEPLRAKLRVDYADGIDAAGLSGGIWAMLDSNRLDVQVLPHGQQAHHLIVKVKKNADFTQFNWIISGIYASTHLEDRLCFWEELQTIYDHYKGSWALIGDFNDVLSFDEKSGGNRLNRRRV